MHFMIRFLILMACIPAADSVFAGTDVEPLVIGDSFIMQSEVLDEERRINVYVPTYYGEPIERDLPVLYMPDGGIHEDFLHVAGLLDVSVVNGTMRPFLLVGMENTERNRDLTGPTKDPRDLEIAPRVGGSKAFRTFIRSELMPEIRARYRVTGESAIIGESLAGLFVVETFFEEPELFDTYIAVDPSLWWNFHQLVESAEDRLAGLDAPDTRLFIASSSKQTIAEPVAGLVTALRETGLADVEWHHESMPAEQHHTIYHPAALKAFRLLFPRPKDSAKEQ